jgi:hypothetical protein
MSHTTARPAPRAAHTWLATLRDTYDMYASRSAPRKVVPSDCVMGSASVCTRTRRSPPMVVYSSANCRYASPRSASLSCSRPRAQRRGPVCPTAHLPRRAG